MMRVQRDFVNRLGVFLLGLFSVGWMASSPLPNQNPVVRAVLFYSPTCPACHHVITTELPPITEKYGDQLLIAGVDVSTEGGQELFIAAVKYFNLPPERVAVPLMIIGDHDLLGTVEIPELLPVLTDEYLEQGGVGWPEIPGLAQALSGAEEQETATAQAVLPTAAYPEETQSPTDDYPPYPVDGSLPDFGSITGDSASMSMAERLAMDPAGNALAIIALILLLAAITGVFRYLFTGKTVQVEAPLPPLILVLCLVGAVVAGYLTYVEMKQVQAVCGPVGDCNTVQHSQYARLFGLIPVGLLGLAGYAAITNAWLVARYGKGRVAALAVLALFGMALGGTLFSVYLTFLEPFVIGATCAWCVTSALLMAALLGLSARPAKWVISNNLHN